MKKSFLRSYLEIMYNKQEQIHEKQFMYPLNISGMYREG
jgi:hypothetical protein